jgi:hypothetical protein
MPSVAWVIADYFLSNPTKQPDGFIQMLLVTAITL